MIEIEKWELLTIEYINILKEKYRGKNNKRYNIANILIDWLYACSRHNIPILIEKNKWYLKVNNKFIILLLSSKWYSCTSTTTIDYNMNLSPIDFLVKYCGVKRFLKINKKIVNK